MKCPKCQTEDPEPVSFCRKCGTKLSLICSKCGFENRPEDNFCATCGYDLATPAEQPPPRELSFEEKLDKVQRYLPGGLTEKILAQQMEKATAISKAANNFWSVSRIESNISLHIFHPQGRLNLAYQTSNEALDMADEVGDLNTMGWHTLAMVFPAILKVFWMKQRNFY